MSHRPIATIVLTVLAALALPMSPSLVGAQTPGLVAAYAFNEGSGPTVTDTSGNNNTGTISGVTWTTAGKFDSALVFNGTSARVTINDSASLHLTTGMTLEAWVNPATVTSDWWDVLYKGDDNYFLEATSTQNGVPGGGGTFRTANVVTYGTAVVPVNTWTHLALTYDGATLRLYVNGEQVSSLAQTGDILTSTNPLQIGGDSLYGQSFQGTIDEVRVYNRALTQAQIQNDMNTPIGGTPPTPAPIGAYVFPLQASANGRYLIDQAGTPFFMLGGSPQLLASWSMADITTYLSNRAAQGFNSIQVYSLPWDFDSGVGLPGGNGAYPFTTKLGGGTYSGESGTADFTTFNPTYFSYLDQVIALATSYGFYIHLYAIDFGYGGDGSQGWWPDVKANSAAAFQSFGQFLGNRYKNQTNIVWVDGSDYGQSSPDPPDATNENKVVGLIQAMQSAGANQLRTGDWNAPSMSTDEPLFTKFMQLNGIYSYGSGGSSTGITYPQARAGWNYVPVAASQGNPGSASIPPALPVYLKETDYENSGFSPGDPVSVRAAQWWAVLAGGTAGLFYENENVLHGEANWQTNDINSTGAQDMKRMSAFVQSLAWWKLVPSELSGMRRLVTSSNGTQTGTPNNYVAAAQASDGTLMLAYVPPKSSSSQSLTVDLRSMAGHSRARWWDPTSGTYTDITGGQCNLANTLSGKSFTIPGANSGGNNDWVLVLDTQFSAARIIDSCHYPAVRD